jgi:RecB family exonuclease
MTHVDAVWDRLDFRTPWSKLREHERVRAALGRFLRWHVANPRRLVKTEAPFETVVTLEGGEQVKLTGYADRIELDADGNVVVVDLKTGRTKPSAKSVESHVQLGLYQYAVDHGAVDELTGGEARAGGAELVQLGILDDSTAAVVQSQDVQPEDGPDRTVLRERLRHTAALLRAEEFPAVAGQHCRDCSFVPICPIKGAGSVTSQ